jgi:hypothetical protein
VNHVATVPRAVAKQSRPGSTLAESGIPGTLAGRRRRQPIPAKPAARSSAPTAGPRDTAGCGHFTAWTIARMPALIASGSAGQASTTVCRSGSRGALSRRGAAAYGSTLTPHVLPALDSSLGNERVVTQFFGLRLSRRHQFADGIEDQARRAAIAAFGVRAIYIALASATMRKVEVPVRRQSHSGLREGSADGPIVRHHS